MASDAQRQAPHDPGARGFDGRTLAPVEPPAAGEPPSPAWQAQLGRAPIGDYAGGPEVVKRLTEGALAVPGDDPLYQYLGVHRVFAEVLKAQHDDLVARQQGMLDEARQRMAQMVADAGEAGAAALAGCRTEHEAALRRFSAEFEDLAVGATRRLREAMAEERETMTAAIAVKLAEALARADRAETSTAGPGGRWRPFGTLGLAWGGRGRSAAAWAALLAVSVIAGLALLWLLGHWGRPAR